MLAVLWRIPRTPAVWSWYRRTRLGTKSRGRDECYIPQPLSCDVLSRVLLRGTVKATRQWGCWIQQQEELSQPFTPSCPVSLNAFRICLGSYRVPSLRRVQLLKLEDEHSRTPPENYTHNPPVDFSPISKLNQLTGASRKQWAWYNRIT